MSEPSALSVPTPALNALTATPAALTGLTRGIEKESLRVTAEGALSMQAHPTALGSALTHPAITTDFSEAQLELITGVHASPEACLHELETVHRFVYQNIGEERLWPSSMPCLLGTDSDVPLGQYGSSNIAQAKTVYRRGLGHRYGRLMQTISGIHYNFSVPQTLWQTLGITTQDQQTAAYFGLIRNFRRWSWLLIYLFGASPAVCKSFTRGLTHNLEELDQGTLHLPYATSLRMGPLGYQSAAQSELHISYNSLDEYAQSMVAALTEEYPPYAEYGLEVNGEYQQLSTTVLQIENEFYGTVRPKRRTESGERPITALRARGVEYVEVRCLDLNPFYPVGIDAEQIRFIDNFLLLCLLADSPADSVAESGRMARNQMLVVERGRDPSLLLEDDHHQQRRLTDWATELLDACGPIADLLDAANGSSQYQLALHAQRQKVADSQFTTSAQIIEAMRSEQIPFFRFSMNQADRLHQHFAAQPLEHAELAQARSVAAESIEQQQQIEMQDQRSFAEFLESYLALPA